MTGCFFIYILSFYIFAEIVNSPARSMATRRQKRRRRQRQRQRRSRRQRIRLRLIATHIVSTRKITTYIYYITVTGPHAVNSVLYELVRVLICVVTFVVGYAVSLTGWNPL